MSGWGDNTHVATAKFRQEGVHEWQAEEGLTEATAMATALDAQIEATLALAYEQRTANLIAWTAGGHPTPEMRALIEERLGL